MAICFLQRNTKFRIAPKWPFVFLEFDKSRAMRACVPTWSTCQRACVPAWFTCQRAKSVPSSHFYVPKCQKTCQRAIRSANVSTWHVNMPNGVAVFQIGVPTCRRARQFFKHSSYEMLREISILYYYIKNSTLYLISYLYISCVYVSYI